MDQPWRIEMLGWLRAVQHDRVIDRFRSQKAAALLAYLAYPGRRCYSRDELIELLWPECIPSAGRRNLRVELASLRRQLEPPGTHAGTLLVASHAAVQLNPAAYTTDVARFEAALEAAARVGSGSKKMQYLAEAIDQYGGELLPGQYAEWILPERPRLADAFLQAHLSLTTQWEQAGDLQQALEWARRAVAADPLHEESRHRVIRLLADTGRTEAARCQFEELERLISQELGAEPAPELRAFVDQLRRGQGRSGSEKSPVVGAPDDIAAIAGSESGEKNEESRAQLRQIENEAVRLLPGPPSSAGPVRPASQLPLQLTRFFGREQEMVRLRELLLLGDEELRARDEGEPASPDRCRLVTFTGPGGSGKTRLALQAVQSLRAPFQDAVWFIPLVDTTDPRFIPDKILAMLRVPRSPQMGALDQVTALLSRQPCLLLLDNFERLVEGGAELLQELLQRVETLTLLVTSRQRLNLEGEHEFPVAPLPVPGVQAFGRSGDQVPTPERLNAERLSNLTAYPSVRLFVDRAQAVRPDFQVTRGNAAAVADLCTRLEGLPLALELAASRIGILTPRQMLVRLSQRFDLLVRRTRGTHSRHCSLRATLEWSYQLLEPELQRFLAQLSVFRGGWTLEAAQTVFDQPRALEYLDQLRECSLVQAEERLGGMRFRQLEALREYGAEQLSVEEQAVLRRPHAGYYLSLAESFDGCVPWDEGVRWLDRLEAELENLRAALDWSAENGEAGIGLRLILGMRGIWALRGCVSEGRHRLAELLALPRAAEDEGLRANAIELAGYLARDQSDYAAARALLEEILELRLQQGDRAAIAVGYLNLGLVARYHGEYERARSLYEQGLAVQRELGCLCGIADALNDLGYVAYLQGDFQSALALLQESLPLRRAQGNKYDVGWSVAHLGEVAEALGDDEAADANLEESFGIWREMSYPFGAAYVRHKQGRAAQKRGDWEVARSRFAESLTLWQELGNTEHATEALEGLAEVAGASMRPERAARLFGAAEALRKVIGSPVPPVYRAGYERSIATARAALGEKAFHAARAAGRAMPREQAYAEALVEVQSR